MTMMVVVPSSKLRSNLILLPVCIVLGLQDLCDCHGSLKHTVPRRAMSGVQGLWGLAARRACHYPGQENVYGKENSFRVRGSKFRMGNVARSESNRGIEMAERQGERQKEDYAGT